MRRIWLSVLIPSIVGVVAGVAVTQAEFLTVEELFQEPYEGPHDASLSQLEAPKVQVVGETEFDFGTMSRNESRNRKFYIKNVGSMPLDVQFQLVSCGKCMDTKYDHEVVFPGDTTEIDVTYSTNKPVTRFSEWIEIKTSDPSREVIRFKITGNVSELIRLSDDKLHLDDLTSNEVFERRFEIFSFHSDQLEITDYRWTNSETADLFSVEFRPGDPSKAEGETPAKAALQAVVTIQPGLPVGPIAQTLEMTAETSKTVELEMLITGKVVSDVSIGGASNFAPDTNILDLGGVDRDEGRTQKLQILVKGPQRHDAELRIASVDPESALSATIGEPKQFNKGVVYMYPLVIEVKKGAPALNRLGSAQGKLAQILIETNLSNARQVLVYVSFAIE